MQRVLEEEASQKMIAPFSIGPYDKRNNHYLTELMNQNDTFAESFQKI
jgi:hypothetical protein